MTEDHRSLSLRHGGDLHPPMPSVASCCARLGTCDGWRGMGGRNNGKFYSKRLGRIKGISLHGLHCGA